MSVPDGFRDEMSVVVDSLAFVEPVYPSTLNLLTADE
jgi:hypothetical protein